jgi:hypothetical protein
VEPLLGSFPLRERRHQPVPHRLHAAAQVGELGRARRGDAGVIVPGGDRIHGQVQLPQGGKQAEPDRRQAVGDDNGDHHAHRDERGQQRTLFPVGLVDGRLLRRGDLSLQARPGRGDGQHVRPGARGIGLHRLRGGRIAPGHGGQLGARDVGQPGPVSRADRAELPG